MKRCFPALLLLVLNACSPGNNAAETSRAAGTFGYDLAFLLRHDSALAVLSSADSSARVIVSAKYQGKVFTSTANGLNGSSFGWINYKALSEKPQPHFNAYGGENRLWLGPEGAQFSLFFKPGSRMDFANWQTPAAFDTEPWTVVSKTGESVALEKAMALTNYAGTRLNLRVDRAVNLLNRAVISEGLGTPLPDSVQVVGYQTRNTLTNTGPAAWTRQTGAPCLWVLDMLVPGNHTTILIPYQTTGTGPVATTDYFGPIPPDRVRYQHGVLTFSADGNSRGKLGLTPQRAKGVAGSYDPDRHTLTITLFDVDKKGTYLNQAWKLVPDPFNGDAVNAYNDGPLPDGTQMGPFYELESVSPAAFLQPGQGLTHSHTVLHLMGNEAQLDGIAQKVLGTSLKGMRE
ncbi:hypothetical protein J2I47_21450 [Fibrella sp. HMF5335]|uniref:Lipoprotein n=1 Tax=Fibrella rubiginis TaxID=2817060 RepID=A0A939GLR2_9BACT|nr:DUF6786 family protein [Fibrella rubiginis]MBO0939135.1 hypothetical protein [Fibrella rubiginis]